MEPGEQLCVACGMCCDGTFFGHVRLGPHDDPKKLKNLGMPVRTSRSQPPVVRFRQPCSALCADRRCRVYADRPAQCRAFECRVYQDLLGRRLALPAALRLVRRGRRRANRVRALLRELGDTEEHLSLSQRFQALQRRAERGALAPNAGDRYAELTQAMHALELIAHASFHQRPEEGGGEKSGDERARSRAAALNSDLPACDQEK